MLGTVLAAGILFNGVAVQEVDIPTQPVNQYQVFEEATGYDVPDLQYTKDDNVAVTKRNGVLHFASKAPKVVYRTKEVIRYVEVEKKPEIQPKPKVTVTPKPQPKPQPKPKVIPQPKPQPKPQPQPKVAPAPVSGSGQSIGTFNFTYYTATCAGCSGITATGVDVRSTSTYQGMKILAVNPGVIPFWSIVEVTLTNGQSFRAIALDTGGKMRQQPNYIDVLVGSSDEAFAKGVDVGSVKIIRKGKG